MESLKEDMEKIENAIAHFEDNSLLGITRDSIKDTFSEVTTALEAIQRDLSQDRAPLMAQNLKEIDGSNTKG